MTRRTLLMAGIFGPARLTCLDTQFTVVRNGRSRRRYLHIHGDEDTAREVLREHMKTHTGTAFLVNNAVRTIPAGTGKLDPNRMFSREGADKNLRALNPEMSEAARNATHARLDRDRERLLKAILPPSGGLLIAIHNNRGYSINDELAISDEKALNAPGDTHEFFLATDAADFRVIAGSPYNVVLQKNGPTDDDGSLSRLTARRGVRYVNLECGIGKAAEQKKMLEWLVGHLKA